MEKKAQARKRILNIPCNCSRNNALFGTMVGTFQEIKLELELELEVAALV